MSIDLRNQAGSFRMGNDLWSDVLALAGCKDWTPAGTKANNAMLDARTEGLASHEVLAVLTEAEAENFGYVSNDGQIILWEDAQNLAAALRAAVDDIPEFDIANPTNILERFAGGDSLHWLDQLIVFLEAGEIMIL